MIREALITDSYAITSLGRRFNAALGLGLPFDPALFDRTAREFILGEDRCAFVLERAGAVRGAILGQIGDHPFWPLKAAHEALWWVDECARGPGGIHLLNAFEDWAFERNAGLIGMVARDACTNQMLARRGYVGTEMHCIRRM